MTVHTAALPSTAVLEAGSARVCGGVAQVAEAHVTVPRDLAKGLLGGPIDIVRLRSDPSFGMSIPAIRWREGTIAGHTAAIADPILPNGLGQSAVLVHANGVLTVVHASGLPMDLVVSVAEEQLR
jgi:hypothetical protein